MIIMLDRPFAVSERGKRANNEDTVYPIPDFEPNAQEKLFLVCDGVGGSEKGEVASALVAESINDFFNTFLENDPTEEFINRAIRFTEARFDEYIAAHPESTGMATTMTLVYLGEQSVVCAHVGDSRIYHIREGEIRFRTEDHSLVNSWVKMGKITPEEAAVHPQKNVITRAIQASGNQTTADVTYIKDIREGDYLFLCTDGVSESFSDEQLATLFKTSENAETIKGAITETCRDNSNDNFSFFLLPIKNVLKTAGYKQFLISFLSSLI